MLLKRSFISALLFALPLFSGYPGELEGLYNGLNPTSITEHLALHKLFPEEEIGDKALKQVEHLLSKTHPEKSDLSNLPISTLSLEGFISFLLCN